MTNCEKTAANFSRNSPIEHDDSWLFYLGFHVLAEILLKMLHGVLVSIFPLHVKEGGDVNPDLRSHKLA